MEILIWGNDSVSREIKKLFTENGDSVCQTDRAEDIPTLLGRTERLDMLVLGVCDRGYIPMEGLSEGLDYRKMEQFYGEYAAAPLKVVHLALPYLARGTCRRICYMNSVLASNNQCYGTDGYGLRMAAAARNMQANILFNRLRKEGYTFRMFGYGQEESAQGQAVSAFAYFVENRSLDEDPRHADENRLVMRDAQGREIPW